jgi:hypothetical protein
MMLWLWLWSLLVITTAGQVWSLDYMYTYTCHAMRSYLPPLCRHVAYDRVLWLRK